MKKLFNYIDISILEKAKTLDIITNYLVKYTNSKDLCFACDVSDNTLVIGSTNSSVLNLLRNYQRDIIKDINFELSGTLKKKLKKIRFKIIKNPKY